MIKTTTTDWKTDTPTNWPVICCNSTHYTAVATSQWLMICNKVQTEMNYNERTFCSASLSVTNWSITRFIMYLPHHSIPQGTSWRSCSGRRYNSLSSVVTQRHWHSHICFVADQQQRRRRPRPIINGARVIATALADCPGEQVGRCGGLGGQRLLRRWWRQRRRVRRSNQANIQEVASGLMLPSKLFKKKLKLKYLQIQPDFKIFSKHFLKNSILPWNSAYVQFAVVSAPKRVWLHQLS